MSKIILLATLLASTAFANNYNDPNIQVFTVNTMEKRCSTEPVLIYKGRLHKYNNWVAQNEDNIIKFSQMNTYEREQALNNPAAAAGEASALSKQASFDIGSQALLGATHGAVGVLQSGTTVLGNSVNGSLGNAVGQGLGQGLAAGVVGGLAKVAYDAYVSDWDYLLIRECNTGEDRTRLISNVISNDELQEDVWVNMAIQDQRGSM